MARRPSDKRSVVPGQVLKKVPRLGTVLMLTYLPMALFAVGIAASMPFMIATLDGRADLLAADQMSRETAEAIHAFGKFAELPFLLATGVAGLFAALGAAVTFWAKVHVENRIREIAEYIESVGSEEQVPTPNLNVPDSLGRLARDADRIAVQVKDRDARLRVEADRQKFEVQVQSGLAMAETEEAVLDIVKRAVGQVGPRQPTQLLLADSTQTHLREAVVSPDAPSPGCSVESPGECIAVRQGQIMTFEDGQALDACPKLIDRAQPADCGLCVPIGVMGDTVGILHVAGSSKLPIVSDVAEMYGSMARNVGSRLGMIRALASSQLQAETDPLTGLLNRRSLDEKFQTLVRTNPRMSLAICDLDHFKRLNDTHGHDTGDRALMVFAQVLKDILRPTDLAARFGGEEFVLVLPSTPLSDAVAVLERGRSRLRDVVETAGVPPFTASIGVASCPEHGRDLKELVHAADQAMYAAKKGGRDRIVTATLESPIAAGTLARTG